MAKRIHITSPAKTIESNFIHYAVEFLQTKGFEVSLARHALGKQNYFAGTDQERLADFQAALDDPSIDVILCSRGGYGSVRIIDGLNFESLKRHNKLIVGFSDITVFHNHVHGRLNLPTVHATVPLNFQSNTLASLDSLINVLEGRPNCYHISPFKLNRHGKVNAEVVGGNLSILYSLIGTNSDIDTSGKILFVEDVGEQLYAIDRMFYSLKKSGKLERLAGLIVGGMSNMKDTEIPFGKTVEEIIADHVAGYNYPVCFHFPAGHIDDNRALILGYEATLAVDEERVCFEQGAI